MQKVYLRLCDDDIKEIKRQDKLVHKPNISLRERRRCTEDRNPYQRDYARILYSTAFRRLQGKMQVLGINNSAFFRNRLTHSLEVAQIAKGIRWKINEVVYGKKSEILPTDIFLLDAAALAHDIGHPAFGHKGERVLNELVQKYGMHFEGNAQNFRVLRYLEKKHPDIAGLNLTYRTLLAINKYLVKEGDGIKKFMYEEDYYELDDFRRNVGLCNTRTIDVQIIELADDIAYAVHDLEDALSQRYFTIDEFLYDFEKIDSLSDLSETEIKEACTNLSKIVNQAKTEAAKSNSFGNMQEYNQVFRRTLVTKLTKELIHDVILRRVSKKEAIEHGVDENNYELSLNIHRNLCKILTKKIFKGITSRPDIALYEARGEIVLRKLFDLYSKSNANSTSQLLPLIYRTSGKGYEAVRLRIRAILDYVAGMMDNYAIETYEKYFNEKFHEIKIQ